MVNIAVSHLSVLKKGGKGPAKADKMLPNETASCTLKHLSPIQTNTGKKHYTCEVNVQFGHWHLTNFN